ncbi:PREDICTED: dynein regulatory complex subunit 3 isoform X2 [Lepidothrix coronata]|uniref:Dynein regulatory complex subunit 3 n=1 Tax=Lepidothrix coronata TaxID=321398 RepID=A0A6J0HVH0_9PASS|nr:PREDICTED: dynein regulatory complex subunit 3 isoform X2 [Lepidothrix coronata]
MSQFYNDVEPNIIDDEMVLKAVEKTCPEDLGELAQGENINFKDVTELQLSFKSILQIDNLWRLENLTKLQLDNNVIEKIEALESLVHLVWLDLSFNNIEVIEGLDTLVKLQDLSLYSNRISKIENMDTLQELQIFSIGKNNLTNLENREDAVSKYQDLTKPLEQEEARALALQEIKQAKQEELEYHGTAFVEHLNGSFLFDSLYEDDTEAAKLASLPGVGDLLQAYRKEFVSVCEKLYNYGLEEYEKREAEVSDFYKKLHEILLASQEESKKAMFDFENRNKQRLDEIHHARSYDVAESKRAECQEDILQLSGTLMTLEALLSNELEEQLQGFKRTIDVIVSTFMENVQEMMGQCRDLENQHHEKLMEVALTTLEKSLKGKLEEDLPADVQTLLVDKNTIVNAVNMSHSIRLRKIDKRESDMLCNTYHWHISVTEKAFQTESDRNRACIKRIMSYINTLQKELDNTKI